MDLPIPLHRSLSAASILLLVGVVHCGGGVSANPPHGTEPDAGGPDHPGEDAAGPPVSPPSPPPQPGPCVGPGGVAPVGRPQATACGRTNGLPHPGGPVSCATNADCSDAGFGGNTCLHGFCGIDQCLTDGDCSSGTACLCANQVGGNAIHGNECIASGCRVDSDCGSGGACSKASTSGCGAVDGLYCHTPSNGCLTNADCCSDNPVCEYDPTQARWTCTPAHACAG